jgi:hypothetical protein
VHLRPGSWLEGNSGEKYGQAAMSLDARGSIGVHAWPRQTSTDAHLPMNMSAKSMMHTRHLHLSAFGLPPPPLPSPPSPFVRALTNKAEALQASPKPADQEPRVHSLHLGLNLPNKMQLQPRLKCNFLLDASALSMRIHLAYPISSIPY